MNRKKEFIIDWNTCTFIPLGYPIEDVWVTQLMLVDDLNEVRSLSLKVQWKWNTKRQHSYKPL